jgi:hypothetical protein
MATHDYEIANQTGANFRADLNNALLAIVSQNSSSTAPATTFANMLWYDTANNQIKKRNEANSAWITLGTVDEVNSKFTPNAAITTSEIAAATLVTASDTIASNDNDTTIPTSAAVDNHIPVKLNAGGSAPIYAARAWVRFNAAGTIAASGNVASVTKNSTGNYTITFTTAMEDADYAVAATTHASATTAAAGRVIEPYDFAAGSFKVQVAASSSGAAADSAVNCVTVFR